MKARINWVFTEWGKYFTVEKNGKMLKNNSKHNHALLTNPTFSTLFYRLKRVREHIYNPKPLLFC